MCIVWIGLDHKQNVCNIEVNQWIYEISHVNGIDFLFYMKSSAIISSLLSLKNWY